MGAVAGTACEETDGVELRMVDDETGFHHGFAAPPDGLDRSPPLGQELSAGRSAPPDEVVNAHVDDDFSPSAGNGIGTNSAAFYQTPSEALIESHS